MKSYGTMEGVYINGAPKGITFHETDNFTLYPASIISINKNRFTKHYFIGDKRVASRIGTGLFNNVYGRNGSYVTAGQQDYAERMNQIQKQKEAYYKEQGIAPGVPTMKGAYGDPENTKRGYNSIIDTLGNHDVPQGWIQTPKPNTTPNTNPGPPVSWNDPSNPDDPQAGYGYIANDTTKEETFFYHSDHLGSTSYITDDKANITQYDAYLPYGELLVDEHSCSEDLPYKFNGKQFDEETGLYYYGARYLNPVASLWYGIDPLAEKYANISTYLYCHNNPINLIDNNGMADGKPKKNGGSRQANLSKITNVENVLKGKKWIDYQDIGSCGKAARMQNNQVKGADPVYDGQQINMYYDNRQAPHSTSPIDRAKGIETIIDELSAGRPVMVGVNYKRKNSPGNNNVSTDHYVNIVGMGTDEKHRYYFSYYDNYADPDIYVTEESRRTFGTDLKENRFYISKKINCCLIQIHLLLVLIIDSIQTFNI